MEITNEIIIKVLVQYLGQEMAFKTDLSLKNQKLTIYLLNTLITNGFWWRDTKLILKPLSAITDEDAIEVAKLAKPKWINLKEFTVKRFITWTEVNVGGYDTVQIFSEGNIRQDTYEQKAIEFYRAYQYLQSKGYDLPNYFLGGKTLEQSGLAIYTK